MKGILCPKYMGEISSKNEGYKLPWYLLFLGGGNSKIFGIFTPWEDDPIWLEHIFQMGWNYQLENLNKVT